MTQVLVQRWQAFLAKIQERLDAIITESEKGMQALFSQHPDDVLPVVNALSGLDARVRVLEDKLQDTWDGQVGDKFEDAGITDRGLDMMADAGHALEWRWSAWKAKITADFYRQLKPTAVAAAAAPKNCSQCGYSLELGNVIVATSVTCPSCDSLNQFSPGPAVLAYFGGMPRAFANEQTLDLRRKIETWNKQRERERQRQRQHENNYRALHDLASLEKWEELERNYWMTHTKILCELSEKPFDQALVDARMTQFIKFTLECEQVWVRAKGRVQC